MAALLRQEPTAAEEVYARFASRIYGLGSVLNKADAEDLVQDTFLKTWRTGSAFDPRRGSLGVRILRVARSLAINLLRRRTVEARKLSTERGSDVLDEPGPERYGELRDLIRRAREAMDRLPPGEGSAVELAYFGKRSSTEVAALKRIPRHGESRIRAGIATPAPNPRGGELGHPAADLRERAECIERLGGAES